MRSNQDVWYNRRALVAASIPDLYWRARYIAKRAIDAAISEVRL